MPIEVVVAQSVHHHQSRKQDLAEQAFTLARRQSSWLDDIRAMLSDTSRLGDM